MNPNWYFLKSGAGIVSANNLANPFKDTQLNDYEILVRETFQNSYDERISDDDFKFRIKKHKIDPELAKKFIEKFNLSEILEKSNDFDDPDNYISNGIKLLSDCIKNSEGFSMLEVSDFNSNGLGGRWNRGRNLEDRFYNLVLSINRSRKQDNSDGRSFIGSHGVGKMVFALSSEIRSILYYSKFEPTDSTDGVNTRLMMTSFLPLIDDQKEDIEYSGHAYFGVESDETNNPRKPITNEKADEIISSLGFETRKDNEYGTSVYLPICDFDILKIKNAFEKWWWPALVHNPNLCIELEDEFGKIFKPDHLTNSFSKPFVDLYKKDKETVSIIHEQKKKDIANIKIDKYTDSLDQDVSNNLACIRGGLVIEYKKPFKEGQEDCFGVVKINDKYEEFFTFSEPEAHDTWNANHKRLSSRYGPSGQKLVQQGLNLINTKCLDFQLRLNSIDKSKSYSGTSFLDDRLSQIFKSLKRGKPNAPVSTSRLPYIHKSSKRISNNETAIDHLYFTVGLNDDIEVENIDYQLKVTLMSVVDTNNSKGEVIPIELSVEEEKECDIQSNSIINFSLNNKKIIKGEAKGKVFSKWTTKWIIELIPVDL